MMYFGANCSRPAGAPPARFRAAGAALLALALVFPANHSGADTPSAPDTDSTDITATVSIPQPGQQDVLPPVNEPFRAGGYLRFSFKCAGISAGSAYLEVPQVS